MDSSKRETKIICMSKENQGQDYTKPEGRKYWEKRKTDDERRDWGTDSDNWITEYWDSHRHPHRDLIMKALHSQSPFYSVLEVGCNCGPNLKRVTDEFPDAQIMGIDVNKEAIENAIRYLPGAFNVASVHEIPLDDKSVDISLCDAILMYITPKEIKEVVKELARVTKKAIVLVEWFDKSELGVIKNYHYARNYPKLFKNQGFILEEEHKITEQEWPTAKSWHTQGYLYVFRVA